MINEKKPRLPIAQACISLARALRRRQIRLYAAQAAYFVLFSTPSLMMLCSAIVSRFVPDMGQRIAQLLVKYNPGSASFINAELIDRFLQAGIPTVSASALVMMWSASKGMRAVCEGISQIYGSHFKEKNFILRYIDSFFYTLLLLVAVTVTMLLMGFGNLAVQFLGKLFPRVMGLLQALADWRFLIVLAMLVLFFWLLYRLMGQKGMPFIGHLPGALFGGGGWVLFSFLLSLYLKYFSNWHSIYGGLSVLLALMLWLYGCMYILMLGALLNVYLQKRPFMIK